MAIVVYSNGIVEEFRSLDYTFTEKELVDAYHNYHTLMSSRLIEIPNTWVLWGEMHNPPENEYNKIGDEILDVEVYSHVMFIHDTEINPKWNATDNIIYKSYDEFSGLIARFLDDVSKDIVRQNQEEMSEEDSQNMIFLITMGHTKDKRVLFAFNPHEQSDMFFVDGSFDKFAIKIFDYVEPNFDPDFTKPFVVFADSKTVVICEDRYVYDLIDRMSDVFLKKEKYEICAKLSDMKNQWRKTHTPVSDMPEEMTNEEIQKDPIVFTPDASIDEAPKKTTRKRKPKNPEQNVGDKPE